MPNVYTGVAGALVPRTGAASITDPVDGDALSAASMYTSAKALADLVAMLQANAGFIGLANTWALLQTFTVMPSLPAPAWVTSALVANTGGSWINGSGGAYPLAATKDAAGVVRLEGLVTKGAASVAGELIATLGAGYRPSKQQWIVGCYLGNGPFGVLPLIIDTAGNIKPQIPISWTSGLISIMLDNISFATNN